MAQLDATNPFAGGLPPPLPTPPPLDPHLDPNNPFYDDEDINDNTDAIDDDSHNSDDHLKDKKETPGGVPDANNPFYKEQQAAIDQYKRQQALDEALEEENAEYEQRQHAMQQEYQQMEHQLNESYYNQQLLQQQAIQQSMHRYMMQSMQQTYPIFDLSNPQQVPPPPPQDPEPPAAIGISPDAEPASEPEPAPSSVPKAEAEAKEIEKEEEEKKSPQELKEAKRQRNRVRAVNELITTETTYISKLELLNQVYITPMKESEKLLKSKFHSILFPQILQTILALNQKLLKSMQVNKVQIGSAMIDFIPYLKMYQNYMNNHEAATRVIKQLRKDKNSDFCKYLAAKEMEQCGFTLESYLILPIQRMPRYELCLKEIIKLTLEDHSDMSNLRKCHASVSGVNKQINIRIKDYETRQRVYAIEERIINLEINRKNKDRSRNSKKLQKSKSSFLFNNSSKQRNSKSALALTAFDDLSSNNNKKKEMSRTRLVQPSRVFIKQGYLTKVSRKKDIRYLFVLFNDLLIYCSETMSDKLILHQRIDITDAFFRIESAVVLEDEIDYIVADNGKKEEIKKPRTHNHNTFEIHSIEKSFLCYAENNKEREEWIDAIERCLDNIKKSGISKRNKSERMDSLSISIAAGSSRFNAAMMAATSPSLIDVAMAAGAQDESRILETAPMFVPNDWSDECMMAECDNKFNTLLLKKRNHCRYCGKLVCDTCCTNRLPHFEPTKRKSGVCVKVCLVCYVKYKLKPLIHNAPMEPQEKLEKAVTVPPSSSKPVQHEEEKSFSFSVDSSDEWEALYNNVQNASGGNDTPGFNANENAMITIPQSKSNLVSNGTDVFANSMMFDVDPMDCPLPDEKDNESVNEDKSSLNQIKYDADMGTVNAIIAANDNLINSMDMSAYENQRNGNKNSGEPHAVVLDENAEAHDSESSEDDFAANFENIVIPDSNRAVNEKNLNRNDELYSFLDSPPPNQNNNNNKKEAIINVMDLDLKHDNVKQLTLFGFTQQNIKDAWALMKQNKAHKHMVPDHGPLFVETILDYLNKVQKQKSKNIIMQKYKDIDSNQNNNETNINRDEFDLNFNFQI